MQTLLYDGSFEGFLCAVFDVYEYKFLQPDIVKESHFKGNIFEKLHHVHMDESHSRRVWHGLLKKLSREMRDAVYHSFLSEQEGIENTLLQFLQYVFASKENIEKDYSNSSVVAVHQWARKVNREKHRMKAFIRFQETADGLFYAIIEPDYDVLPLIAKHFKDRYADQRWMIWDAKRKYGLYYDLKTVATVSIHFGETTNEGKDVENIVAENEVLYQTLWQQYFKSTHIAARKNTKLHVQHMPRRYWKYLTEKQPGKA